MEKAEGPLRRLPSGPHGIPAELVERNQRERLIAAMAEVCGERGYAESSVAEISKRAGVSTASFYRQFKDRRECMLASFEELFERLIAALEASCREELESAARAKAGAATAAALLASDRPTARLLSLEVLAAGPEGARAQHNALERLARLLRTPDPKPGGKQGQSRPDRAWTAIAAMTSLVAGRVSEGRDAESSELEAIAEVF